MVLDYLTAIHLCAMDNHCLKSREISNPPDDQTIRRDSSFFSELLNPKCGDKEVLLKNIVYFNILYILFELTKFWKDENS